MSSMKSDSPPVAVKAVKFKGQGSHEFMIWLSEWKKYLVYHGIHRIILEGLDYSQGRQHQESTDFKVDEIDFFMNFWNSDILLEKQEDTKIVRDEISSECPWIWGYFAEKQITVGASLWESVPIEEPDWHDVLYALISLELIDPKKVNTATLTPADLPFPKIYVAQSQAELDARVARTAELHAIHAGNDPDEAAVAYAALVREQNSICVYDLPNKAKRTTISDAFRATKEIVERRLLNRQFKNDDELHADQNLEIARNPVCSDFNIYVKFKLGSKWAVFDKELREAYIANEKRAHKSNETSQSCLDAMALLGDIQHITDAEEALRRKDYHRCFLAVDNYYMRSGSQDVGRFRKEAESFRIQPGQDLNSHLELMRASIERWLNIEFMEQKSLEFVAKAPSSDPHLNHGASIFILDHPEVAFDNSLDLTDAEILAKGPPSIILLSEAKRFTLYADSVKSNPRFENIVATMHAADPSTRTVRSLLQSLRNYELSTSGKDDLAKERSENPNYRKDIKSYLAKVHGTDDFPQSEKGEKKSVHFTSGTKGESSSSSTVPARKSRYPRNQSEVVPGDIPYCKHHLNVQTHWTWDCHTTIKENAAKAAEAKADNSKKSWQKPSGQSTSSNSMGCPYCFSQLALRPKSLTHSAKECRLDPKSPSYKPFKGKGPKTSNLHIKDALREVLDEPAEKGPKKDKKRKHKQRKDRSESESGEEESDHSSDDCHPHGSDETRRRK